MTKMIRMFLVAALAAAGTLAGAGIARADVDCDSNCTNQQDGDNEAASSQNGSSNTGDAVGGQVVGVVSSGDASVDAKNRSEKVDIETGAAFGENLSAAFVGLNASTFTDVETEDATANFVTNQQDGDNELNFDQSADATTGDGVGGQVIGVVTSAGGSADVVADNGSKKIDIETGGTDASNESAAFVGLNDARGLGGTEVDTVDVDANFANNQQDGDNTLDGEQAASAESGDGVGGQVLGIVSAGDAFVDAKNRSEKIDLETGFADADNDSAAFVGLNTSTSTTVGTDDAEANFVFNQQEGDNDGTVSQTADASSGDAVGGQVAGVVTSAGGSADLVLDNASKKIDGETGLSEFFNNDELFVGLNFNTDTLLISGF